MKRLRTLFLLMILIVSTIDASTMVNIFGLKNQDFEDLTTKKINRYKINDNLMVSLKLLKSTQVDGYYPEGGRGSISLKFKRPAIKNWVYTTSIYAGDGNKYSTMTFVDETGIEFS